MYLPKSTIRNLQGPKRAFSHPGPGTWRFQGICSLSEQKSAALSPSFPGLSDSETPVSTFSSSSSGPSVGSHSLWLSSPLPYTSSPNSVAIQSCCHVKGVKLCTFPSCLTFEPKSTQHRVMCVIKGGS